MSTQPNNSQMNDDRVIVIGAGLAGLSCAFELVEQGKSVLVLEAASYVGGRTGNWNERGMEVESGFHKFIGYYKALPDLLERAGIDLDDMLVWETTMEVRHPNADEYGEFGLDVIHAPLKTLSGVLGNNNFITPADKASLIPFLAAGFKECVSSPEELDLISVLDFANQHGVSEQALQRIVEPLSSGIFFMPLEKYSAYAFFGLFLPGIPRIHKMRIGAFTGGMTDVMCAPLAAAITQKGGQVRINAPVIRLLYDSEGLKGVELENGEQLSATRVVVATNIRRSQQLLEEHFSEHEWFQPFLSLDAMPHVTAQFESELPLLPEDRTTFGPGTDIGSFGEQSRTTFRGRPGRASIILVNPDELIDLPDEEVWERTKQGLVDIGLAEGVSSVTDYRIVRGNENFYRISPGNEPKRPEQMTPIQGLYLAGDYTKQPMFTTMEGAVISGQKAAAGILNI
ncbi:hydroxysqualene dehydroxylase [Paenibacillus xylanexedens]|uniref:hydroxysqualene dehydroxylase n=1 Tax=Paenibacillus xylanexedens TaxID=528191 RepID=UPI0028CB13E5|nr:FAD-dependent oxidoreductase [Paenibacillus xylanexedens]